MNIHIHFTNRQHSLIGIVNATIVDARSTNRARRIGDRYGTISVGTRHITLQSSYTILAAWLMSCICDKLRSTHRCHRAERG